MKGLVLAGGTGTRLRPLTYSGAKQLVPVANRPILFYVFDNLAEAGIHDIVLIVSPETGREVEAAIGDGSRWQARVTFVTQQHPGGLAHAVKVAAPALGGDDFCMFLGDNLIGTKIRGAAEAFRASRELSALIMLKEVPNPSSFGIAEVNASGEVVGLVEKPANPRSNLALVGIYFFRHAIFTAIDRIRPSARGELEITDAISELIASGGRVRFDRVSSWWLDTGKKDDLLLANDTVLDSWLVAEVLGTVDADSKVMGRVRIERGARVVRSVIRGPTIIGEGAVITDSRIGPFTSVGPGVRVERSVVDRCVIMEESTVEGVERLEDSLVGRRVVIHRAPRPGQTLSLLVGDDCRVEL
jgi:glucose-1-phosphate thymidylyltransferase